MAVLNTVADYVSLTRTLLQDQVDSPYRYADTELVLALNLAIMEAKKLRPDLFINKTTPAYTANDTTVVVWDEMYRMPLVYYMCGHAQMRDDEAVQDQRAAAFMGIFSSKLLTVS